MKDNYQTSLILHDSILKLDAQVDLDHMGYILDPWAERRLPQDQQRTPHPPPPRSQGSKSSDREITSPEEYAACFQIDVSQPTRGYGYCDLLSKSVLLMHAC